MGALTPKPFTLKAKGRHRGPTPYPLPGKEGASGGQYFTRRERWAYSEAAWASGDALEEGIVLP